jgi:ABC-type Mn2+/Zn2+ transport system ATPase subunit
MPQRPYMPIGWLRRAVTYPEPAESRTSREIVDALHDVGLDHLVERLDEEGSWDQTLSGGEKQRLAFARMFLQGPEIVVLDEATASTRSSKPDRLMEKLVQRSARMTLISVGHRAELESYHNRKITLERRRGGTRLVSDISLLPQSRLTCSGTGLQRECEGFCHEARLGPSQRPCPVFREAAQEVRQRSIKWLVLAASRRVHGQLMTSS